MSKNDKNQLHNIVIFGNHDCPFCIKAKQLVKNHKKLKLKKFIPISISELKVIKNQIKTNKYIPNTVPLILDNGDYLGGFAELSKKYS